MFLVRFLTWESRTRFNQYIIAVILSVPLLCFGMIQGWLSPMRSILESTDSPSSKPYTKDQYAWAASVTYITAIVLGAPLGYMVDKYGRKAMSLLTIASLVAYWAIKILSLEPGALIFARAVAGFPCSACYIIMPVYIKEISDKELRSALGSLVVLLRNVGYLLSYVLADLLSVSAMLWVGVGVPILTFLLFLVLPETPEYLVKEGKIEEAKEVLAWLRGTRIDDCSVEREIDEIMYCEKQRCTRPPSALANLLFESPTRKAFFITVFIKITQQFDGYLIILIYASFVFEIAAETVNLDLSPNHQVMVVGAVQLLGSVFATILVEKTGTKLLLVGTSFLVGLGMLVLAAWFYMTSEGMWLPGWIPVAALCVAIFADAAGFQPVSYLVITDLFGFHLRGQVSAFSNVCAKAANFVQTKWFHDLTLIVGIHWTFLGFAIVCFVACLFSVIWFPETRGRTLEDIYEELSGKHTSKECVVVKDPTVKECAEVIECPAVKDPKVKDCPTMKVCPTVKCSEVSECNAVKECDIVSPKLCEVCHEPNV